MGYNVAGHTDRHAATRRWGQQFGASAVEYAIMVSMIAVVVIAAVAFIGYSLKSDFECSSSWIASMPSDPGCTP